MKAGRTAMPRVDSGVVGSADPLPDQNVQGVKSLECCLYETARARRCLQRVRGCAFNSKCGWLGLGGTDYTEPDRKFVAELSQRWVGQEVGPHEDHKRTTSTKCTGKT